MSQMIITTRLWIARLALLGLVVVAFLLPLPAIASFCICHAVAGLVAMYVIVRQHFGHRLCESPALSVEAGICIGLSVPFMVFGFLALACACSQRLVR